LIIKLLSKIDGFAVEDERAGMEADEVLKTVYHVTQKP
jgi:hypothetical protein